MTKGKNKIFIILKGFIPTEREGKHAFISKDYQEACLYAENWVKDNKEYGNFNLYEIGKIEKGELKEERILIKQFWNTFNKEYSKQAELIRLKKECEEASKERETKEILKILFNAREIKND